LASSRFLPARQRVLILFAALTLAVRRPGDASFVFLSQKGPLQRVMLFLIVKKYARRARIPAAAAFTHAQNGLGKLVKSEPDDWSWAQQVAKGKEGAEWTGIRNHTAQRNLRAMKKGELAFFYHTGKEKAVVGIVKVIAEAHPDSTDTAWGAVDVATVEALPTPVSLARIKADKRLGSMTLVRISRLSVQPVTDAEWRLVCQMGGRS
jgi:predicted RNA-binding protein with PUA-like domain